MKDLSRCWLHLAALWALAIVQPLFEVLADSPEFFVARRNTTADIVVLAVGLVLVPPTLMVAVEALFLRVPHVGRAVHLLFVAVLSATFVVQILDDVLGAPAGVVIVLAGLFGAGFTAVYALSRGLPALLSALSPAALLFLVLFLFFSPVSDLVLRDQGASAARGVGGNGAPVVVVIFDEFSSASLVNDRGRIDPSRYPNLARLAGDGTWYPNATTVADRTQWAVPALLTGRVPPESALPIAADHPRSLFSLLGDGYRFNVEEPVTDVCPESLCGEEARPSAPDRLSSLVSDLSVVSLHLIFPDDLADDLPAIDQTFGDFRGGGRDKPAGVDIAAARDINMGALNSRIATFRKFDGSVRAGAGRPALNFLHIALPHRPWEYLPDGTQYQAVREGLPPGERLVRDPTPARQMLQEYMLQAAYSDRLLGRLFDRLRRLGVYDRALVVVAADHGISFRPGGQLRLATQENIGEVAGVPLIIKTPHQPRGRLDRRHARTIDVLPTIADALDLTPPWPLEGRSLLAPQGQAPGSVRVKTTLDATTAVSYAAFRRSWDAAAGRIGTAFGPGVSGLFRVGADGSLVGREVTGFRRAPAGSAQVELDTPGALSDVRLGQGKLPLSISGRLTEAGRARPRLAIALNGRVAAVTRAFVDQGELAFLTLVAPDMLVAGNNRLAVYEITGEGSTVALGSLSLAGQVQYALDGRTLRGPGGAQIRVEEGAVAGFVDGVRREPGDPITVDGWAATRAGRPADAVLLFAGDRFVAAREPSQERRDVADDLGPGALRSGFSMSAPPGAVSGDADLRVFAVSGSRATELDGPGGS